MRAACGHALADSCCVAAQAILENVIFVHQDDSNWRARRAVSAHVTHPR